MHTKEYNRQYKRLGTENKTFNIYKFVLNNYPFELNKEEFNQYRTVVQTAEIQSTELRNKEQNG